LRYKLINFAEISRTLYSSRRSLTFKKAT
jgi:hypothetical protein